VVRVKATVVIKRNPVEDGLVLLLVQLGFERLYVLAQLEYVLVDLDNVC
jgi:hypothetical protein